MVVDRSPAVTLDAVAKIYPGKAAPALVDLSVTIEPGQFVAVIGKSGAGKTTLLRCLSRATTVSRGAIRFDQTDLAELRGRALRAHRTRVGMIYQQFNLVRRLSVVDNVLIGRLGRLGGFERWAALVHHFDRAQREIAFRCLDHVGLLDRVWQICPFRLRYSGNTPQRPTQGDAFGLLPASRWQLVQLRPLPTYAFADVWVSVSTRLPYRTAAPTGPSGMVLSSGAWRGTTLSILLR